MSGTIVVVYGIIRDVLGNEGLSDKKAFYVGDPSVTPLDFDEFWKKITNGWLRCCRSDGFIVLHFSVTYMRLPTGEAGTLYSTCN